LISGFATREVPMSQRKVVALVASDPKGRAGRRHTDRAARVFEFVINVEGRERDGLMTQPSLLDCAHEVIE
jgi:hypothetical protein